MLNLPGVVRSNQGGSLDGGIGAVNGARARSNNFMIDGTQNNDISIAGPALTLTNNDALQEVAVQTSNFTAEFGRSGGAIVNQVTKSGTNNLHGTVATVYRSQVLNATTRTGRIAYNNSVAANANDPRVKIVDAKNKFKENIPAFTIGGPVVIPGLYDGHNKTFFFGAGQWDRYSANATTSFTLPTAAGVAVLQPLAASCPNVQKYLTQLGSLRGLPGPGDGTISIAIPTTLGATSCGGGLRTGQSVGYGVYDRVAPRVYLNNNHLIRIDHVVSDKQNVSFRWFMDNTSDTDGNIGITPEYDIPFKGRSMSGALNHVYLLKNNLINEFRFSYSRNNLGWFFTDAGSLGATLPDISITTLSNLAVSSAYPQGRISNSWQYQDVMGWTKGKHAIRFGGEVLRQLAAQVAPFNGRGTVNYTATNFIDKSVTPNVTYVASGLANFIDDYSGTSTNPASILFGSGKYRPNLFTYAIFLQDSYKLRSDLTINAGLRYENYGQPANQFKHPAFVGYSDADILSTAKVNPDNNNFAPSVGFSWNPRWTKGIGGFLSGDGKTVLRGGYQISYDTWYNNLLSNMAGASPNALASATVTGGTPTTASPRGRANLSAVLPTLAPVAVNGYSAQQSVFGQNIRNPYYHRFSLGIQRELPASIVMDLSYVGTLGRQLLYTNPLNPALPNADGTKVDTQANGQTLRVYPNRGTIQIRDSGLTSSYNAMQLLVRRKYMQTAIGGMAFSGAYTWSRNMDVLSETFASNSSGQNPSRSPVFGSIKALDWGPADNDRRHVMSSQMIWDIRGPKSGFLGQIAGGWSIAPILTIQSGTPFTILNGTDRDMDGSSLGDRPNIGNTAAPINSRAKMIAAGTLINGSICASRLQNVATNACVTKNDVYWILVNVTNPGPEFGTPERRNANYTKGYMMLDANIKKVFKLNEQFKLEYRAEIFNLLNKENFDTPVSATNRNVTAGGTANFMNYSILSGGSRTMRMGLKVMF
ncbi:MAG TPA: hypothetical protein VN622_00530 [Clostridia bacterium]|nr:hypothetical protein [Clostridia bacterium]